MSENNVTEVLKLCKPDLKIEMKCNPVTKIKLQNVKSNSKEKIKTGEFIMQCHFTTQ